MSISTTLLAPQTGTAERLHRGQVLAIIDTTIASPSRTNYCAKRLTTHSTGYDDTMEGSTNNCRGDGCKCRAGADGEYCDPKCKASNDNASCQCEHAACVSTSGEAKQAAREATQGDEKVS
jgi:hypothetical protein